MRLLVATRETNGRHPGDYDHCIEGELVWLQRPCAWDTRDPAGPCGCSRGFSGLSSHKATTTALVVDSPLTEADVRQTIRASLADGGWLDPAWCSPELADEQVDEALRVILAITARFAAGAVLRRWFDLVHHCACGAVPA